jgi:hypothetical protein
MSPGPAAFSALLASEPLHTALFVAAFGLALVALDRGWVAWLGVGTLLGLSQYVRPAGLVIVPAFVLLPFLLDLPRRRAAVAALSLLIAFGIVLAPSVAWQYQRYGRVSLSTSNFDGWSLLVGLNLNSLGQYNREDLALVNAPNASVEFRDRSYRLAIERLSQHPEWVGLLAAPKFGLMWGVSTYGATLTLDPEPPGHGRARAALTALSQVGYTTLALLAAAWLWTRRHRRDGLGLLALLTLESVALAAVFLEVQPRYHAFFEPILCLFAGASVALLADWTDRRSAVPKSGHARDRAARSAFVRAR